MHKKVSVILFAVIILMIPVISLLSPYKQISEQENRVLASFPVFNFKEFTSKRFMSGFDSFVSDHIAFRDGWTALKADFTVLLGRRDNRGVYLGDNCLIENLNKPDETVTQLNLQAIDKLAKSTGKPTYLLLAPTASEIERDRLPPFATTYDEKTYIAQTGKLLHTAKLINIVPTLREHNSEYIYYRTDHHWTSLGAYYAYMAASGTLGYSPLSTSAFDIEQVTRSFNGTLYSKSGYRSVTPDAIDLYEPKTGSPLSKLVVGTGDSAKTYNSIYFKGVLSSKDKYSVFFDGNQAREDIFTTSAGKRLLVIKDSYAHSLVPFLMNHYSRITMLDTRYLVTSLNETVNMNDYDQVLFLYNVDTFGSDNSIHSINEP